MSKCFECGIDKKIVHHHVVPESLGGTKTISLCEFHHSLVHSKNLTKMSELKDKKKLELIKNGFWNQGKPVFGYKIVGSRTKKRLEIDDNEAEIVSYIFKKTYELVKKNLYSKNRITRKTLESLRAKRYTSTNGAEFKRWNVSSFLKNKTFIGYMTYNGKLYPHSFGNIIDKNIFEAIQVWKAGPDGVPR